MGSERMTTTFRNPGTGMGREVGDAEQKSHVSRSTECLHDMCAPPYSVAFRSETIIQLHDARIRQFVKIHHALVEEGVEIL